MADRTTVGGAGFGRSAKKTFTIVSGGTTSEFKDLGRPYMFLVIECADCSHIQAGTSLTLALADDDGDTPCTLYDAALGTALPSGSLPTSGTYRIMVQALAKLVKLTLSQATSGGTAVFSLYGYDPVAG